MSETGRGREWAIRALLVAASTAVLCGTLEIGARAVGLRKGLFIPLNEATCLQRSAPLGFEQRPHCRSRNPKGIALATNSIGLRGDELRDDGSVRILALGDSSTWGWGVMQHESYPARLQVLLDERAGPGRFQVINAGVPGYASYQGLVYLRARGLALDPAVVIIAFGFNDALAMGDDQEHIERLSAFGPLPWIDDWLLERSRFYSWLRWQIHGTTVEGRAQRAAPYKYGANLREMVHLARAQGAAVLLLQFPQPTDDQRAHVEALTAVARELDVPILVYEGPRLDAVHPTVVGYQILAARLADWVMEYRPSAP